MELYSTDEQLVCKRATAQAIGQHLRGIYETAVEQPIPFHWTVLLDELATREQESGPAYCPTPPCEPAR